jgi:hypothetical protein
MQPLSSGKPGRPSECPRIANTISDGLVVCALNSKDLGDEGDDDDDHNHNHNSPSLEVRGSLVEKADRLKSRLDADDRSDNCRCDISDQNT